MLETSDYALCAPIDNGERRDNGTICKIHKACECKNPLNVNKIQYHCPVLQDVLIYHISISLLSSTCGLMYLMAGSYLPKHQVLSFNHALLSLPLPLLGGELH